jgi:hypothetical protein
LTSSPLQLAGDRRPGAGADERAVYENDHCERRSAGLAHAETSSKRLVSSRTWGWSRVSADAAFQQQAQVCVACCNRRKCRMLPAGCTLHDQSPRYAKSLQIRWSVRDSNPPPPACKAQSVISAPTRTRRGFPARAGLSPVSLRGSPGAAGAFRRSHAGCRQDESVVRDENESLPNLPPAYRSCTNRSICVRADT